MGAGREICAPFRFMWVWNSCFMSLFVKICIKTTIKHDTNIKNIKNRENISLNVCFINIFIVILQREVKQTTN